MPNLLSFGPQKIRPHKVHTHHPKSIFHPTHLSSVQLRWTFLIALVGGAVAAAFIAASEHELSVGSFAGGLSTELFGAVLTFIAIDILINRAEKAEESAAHTNARIQRLIHDMGSQNNHVALQAVEELRREGWLTDGALQGAELRRSRGVAAAYVMGIELRQANLQAADLNNAKLEVADLEYAQLQGADIIGANLQSASLYGANLTNAQLIGANLQGATLWYAMMQGADLEAAKLQDAKLIFADLKGADLREARLQGAKLEGANLENVKLTDRMLRPDCELGFDEQTILPDGTLWNAAVDIEQFTDSNHPDFWRSDDPHSPAYRNRE
jgi:uncharacterized protein YjbI with pentapeptide repeats